MFLTLYTGYTPKNSNVSAPFSNYTQQFSLTIPYNRTTNDNIQVMPFLMSVSNTVFQGFSYFNITQFTYTSNVFTFVLNVTYSLVQNFCLSVLTCHFTNLKKYQLQNASYISPQIIDSTGINNLAAAIKSNFGIYSVYGPVFDYKCVIGFTSLNIFNFGNTHAVYFDFTTSPNVNNSVDKSSSYLLTYHSFCFVDLQCQFLYQQYYIMINDCQNTCTLSNCQTCSTATSCSQCLTGHFLNSIMRCQPCIAKCAKCSNTANCDNCIPGYFFNMTAQQCQTCTLNCLTCSSFSCNSCIVGYFANGTGCTPCGNTMPNCITCSGPYSCNSCK